MVGKSPPAPRVGAEHWAAVSAQRNGCRPFLCSHHRVHGHGRQSLWPGLPPC